MRQFLNGRIASKLYYMPFTLRSLQKDKHALHRICKPNPSDLLCIQAEPPSLFRYIADITIGTRRGHEVELIE